MARVTGDCVTRKRLREAALEDKMQHDPILYDGVAERPDTMTERDPPTYVTAPGRRIVAIGDVHGDLAMTESALQLAGVLSSDGLGHWVGSNTIVVQVGDILDRGEDEIAILSLLHNLSQQAQCTGGAVFQLNGNHETLNVGGNFQDVTTRGFGEAASFIRYCEVVCKNDYEAAFSGWYLASKKRKSSRSRKSTAKWASPHRLYSSSYLRFVRKRRASAREFLFRPGGPIARKLSQHGVVLKVNDWLFAHGGVLPLHVEFGLKKLNDAVAQWMRGDNQDDQQSQALFKAIKGKESIVWSRLYSEGEFKASAMLEATLKAAGAKALVVGHSIQATGANSECQGKVWRIDVGMSSGVRSNGQPQVLEILGDKARVLSARNMEEN